MAAANSAEFVGCWAMVPSRLAGRWARIIAATSTPGSVEARASFAGRSAAGDAVANQRYFGTSSIRDLVVIVLARLAHELVPLEAVKRVVDLPDIDGSRAAGAPVQLGSKLIAVTRPLVEKGEQAETNGHAAPWTRLPGM